MHSFYICWSFTNYLLTQQLSGYENITVKMYEFVNLPQARTSQRHRVRKEQNHILPGLQDPIAEGYYRVP